mmetsp:Transcript_17275/g.37267  ORF Transcript_17275/g.37267 Transcript_17275/m.37267 type:complete len:224 (-) Transcript_17275:655-1326(-)
MRRSRCVSAGSGSSSKAGSWHAIAYTTPSCNPISPGRPLKVARTASRGLLSSFGVRITRVTMCRWSLLRIACSTFSLLASTRGLMNTRSGWRCNILTTRRCGRWSILHMACSRLCIDVYESVRYWGASDAIWAMALTSTPYSSASRFNLLRTTLGCRRSTTGIRRAHWTTSAGGTRSSEASASALIRTSAAGVCANNPGCLQNMAVMVRCGNRSSLLSCSSCN